MVHFKPTHLYKFLPVAAISNRVYSGAIGNRGYEIVKVVSSVLNYAEKAEGSTRAQARPSTAASSAMRMYMPFFTWRK
jgi:hypothetical protein